MAKSGERTAFRNQDLPAGVFRTKDGHLRYSSPKSVRGKYVHRAVIEELLEMTTFSIRILIPYPYEVHHQDYNKENNVPGNLILLSNAFHSALTADRRRNGSGRFSPKWLPPPAWSLFNDEMTALPDNEDEVPF